MYICIHTNGFTLIPLMHIQNKKVYFVVLLVVGKKKIPKDTHILVPEGNDVPLHCKRELNFLVEQL